MIVDTLHICHWEKWQILVRTIEKKSVVAFDGHVTNASVHMACY